MAFPTTITTDGNGSVGIGGPFIFSGSVYVIVRNDTNTALRALKGVNPDTAFSAVGTDVSFTAGAVAGIDGLQIGDTIHIASMHNTNNNIHGIRHHVFNMSSDSWTTTHDIVKDAYATAPGKLGQYNPPSIAARTTGEMVVQYNGTTQTLSAVEWERVYIARGVTGSWSSDIALDNGGQFDWYAGKMVTGSGNRIHTFFQDLTSNDLYQRCYTSANALEAFPAAFDTAAYNDLPPVLQKGVSYVNASGDTIVTIPIYANAQTINQLQFVSTDAPTYTYTSAIASSAPTVPAVCVACFAIDGTTVWNYLIQQPGNIGRQSQVSGTAMGAVSNFLSALAATNVYTNVYTRGSALVMGIAYHDTDPKYTEATLSSLAAAAQALMTLGMLGVGR